jgi:hypothetical protein
MENGWRVNEEALSSLDRLPVLNTSVGRTHSLLYSFPAPNLRRKVRAWVIELCRTNVMYCTVDTAPLHRMQT